MNGNAYLCQYQRSTIELLVV
jgi:hypothetical protein